MSGTQKRRAVLDAYGRKTYVPSHGEAAAERPQPPRTLGEQQVNARLRSAAGAAGGSAVDAAAQTLSDMFLSLTNGRAMNLDTVTRAGDQVIDAIAELGVAPWMDTVRAYHEGTFQHCLIVTGLATLFGQKTGMRRRDVALLTMAGLLHDIGKARIPLAILDKQGPLTDREFGIVRAHPAIGYDYLLSLGGFPPAVLSAVRHHHEYLDGSGYPDGLSGAGIDDVTRILTICDIYGALIEQRAYKEPKTAAETIGILMEMGVDGKVETSLVRAFAERQAA